jgi:hypothetical protein
MAKRSDGGVGARGNHGIAFLGRNKTLVVPIAMSRPRMLFLFHWLQIDGGWRQPGSRAIRIHRHIWGEAGSKESGKGDDDMEY